MNEVEMTMNDKINSKGLISYYIRAGEEEKAYIRKNYNIILGNYSIVIW